MQKLFLLALSAALLAFTLSPQWRSFDRMGLHRHRTLNQQPKEILVGVCWPVAENQDGMADGIALAQQEINAGGLANGWPVRVILRDDGFDLEKAKRTAIEFSDTPQMSAVLGYYDDTAAIKALGMYESARLLHLMVGVNNTAMTTHGDRYIIRTILSSDKIARGLAKLITQRGHKKVAVIWEEGGYGEDLAYQFRVALDQLDGEVAYQFSYARERADFSSPVNELKEAEADLIFFAGLEPWAGDFVRLARSVGIKTEIVGAFSDTPTMRSRAGTSLEGAMYFDFYNVNSPTEANQAFVRKFRNKFGRNPDTWAALGYDALFILAKAVNSTRSANSLDLSSAIRFMAPWEGAVGRYDFDRNGELEDKPFYLTVIRNGEPVIIETSTPSPPPAIR